MEPVLNNTNMESFDGVTTDALIDEIVLKCNGPLPGYDKNEKCFVSMVLVPRSQIKPGMGISEMYHGARHLSYRDACIRIIIDSAERDRINAAESGK